MAKIFTGKVVSTKMQKTVIVEVERIFQHSLYKKTITRHKKYKARNILPNITEGTVVKIKETRPISKEVHFQVIEKISS